MCNEYPCEEHLQRFRTWDYTDWRGLLAQLEESWHIPDWGICIEEGWSPTLFLHTGGWSGNEEIIGALMDNQMFWTMYWESSRRGGHYEFRFPAIHREEQP